MRTIGRLIGVWVIWYTMVLLWYTIVHNMRDLKYKLRSFRLSDEVLEDLDKRRRNYKSWNLLFKELLNIKTPFKLRQRKLK